MVAPIVLAIGSAAGSAGMSAAGMVVGSTVAPIIGAAMAPTVFNVQMNWYRQSPCLPPSPEVILQAYNRGFMPRDAASTVLRNQGVNWGMEVDGTVRLRNHGRAWEACRELYTVRPTVSAVMDMWSRGYWTPDSNLVRQYITQAGGKYDEWRRLLPTYYNTPSVGDILVNWNRGNIDEPKVDELLKKHGYGIRSHRNMLKDLRYQIPGPSDLVRFAVKEAFSPDIANALKMYDEFPDDIMPHMEAQGLAWNLEMEIVANGQERNANVADLYWASHWQPISPGQAFQMMHRLRPERIARYRARGLLVEPFTMDNVRQWLRINDYSPTVRDQLAALSYTPLRLMDIRRGIALGYGARNDPDAERRYGRPLTLRLRQLTRQWAIESYQDRGVHPEDAAVQADAALAAAFDQRFAPIRRLEQKAVTAFCNQVIKARRVGIITEDEMADLLKQQGMSDAAIDTFARVTVAEAEMDSAASILKVMHRKFILGEITEVALQGAMLRSGIVNDMADTYIAKWKIERDFTRRAASTAQIQRWVSRGFITPQDARTRLANLGWTNADVAVLMQEAYANAMKILAATQKSAYFDARRAASDLQKIQNELARQMKANQAELRRITPRSTLDAWLRKGIISREEYLERLVAMGIPLKAAEKYAVDATTCPKCKCSPSGKCPEHGGPIVATQPPRPAVADKEPFGPVDTTVPHVDTTVAKVDTTVPHVDTTVAKVP